MLLHSLESSDLPSLLEVKAHSCCRMSTLFTLSGSIPAFCATPGSFSLALAVLFHTRQGFASLVVWAYSFPKHFGAARVPEGECL